MDGKREVLPQKEFQELKDQVTPLEKRFTEFRGRLTKAIDDNKRTIKRQKEFDQGHVKIRSVLETVLGATDKTTFDETDTAVDLERVEVTKNTSLCPNISILAYPKSRDLDYSYP